VQKFFFTSGATRSRGKSAKCLRMLAFKWMPAALMHAKRARRFGAPLHFFGL
jgi:hypothetical protein